MWSHSSLCQEVIGSIVLAVNSASPFLTHDSWVSVSILFRVTQEEMAGQCGVRTSSEMVQ